MKGGADVLPSSGGAQTVSGAQSSPGWCVSPANAEGVSAQTRARETKSFFTSVTPLAVIVDKSGRVPARTGQHTAQPDSDLVLFRALATRKDFDELTRLCRERLLTAPDMATALRWTKDRAIVEALRENFTASYDLLASAHHYASSVEGTGRAKYENEFGIVLARLGRSSLALDRFGLAYQTHHKTGNATACAEVDHNRARALMTRGETAKATRYLERALNYARANNDYRLEMEICESIVEFTSTAYRGAGDEGLKGRARRDYVR